MVREITKDIEVLSTVSKRIDPNSDIAKNIIEDLIDTATYHKDKCVGLAGIQIVEPYRIIVVYDGEKYIPFINPTITKMIGNRYETHEGCMSLDGVRLVSRSTCIEVMHQKGSKFIKERYTGRTAQILQHEIDHLNGKLI